MVGLVNFSDLKFIVSHTIFLGWLFVFFFFAHHFKLKHIVLHTHTHKKKKKTKTEKNKKQKTKKTKKKNKTKKTKQNKKQKTLEINTFYPLCLGLFTIPPKSLKSSNFFLNILENSKYITLLFSKLNPNESL